MFSLLARWYSLRIINVNVNIILAGVLALGPVLGVVRIMEHLLATKLAGHERLQTHHQAIISGATFISDVCFDVVIYYGLHWLANHLPAMVRARKLQIETVADAAVESVPFFKDATKVQLQRMVLSPLLYLLWLGTQFVMMNTFEFDAVRATMGGFVVAIAVVRTLHTMWMLAEMRKARLVAKAASGGNAKSRSAARVSP